MKKLPINLADLAEAMTMYDGLSQAAAYLDLKTGEIIHRPDPEFADEDDFPDFDERPDEFLFIDQLDSRDGFRIMENFVADLDEGEAKKALTRNLSGPRPFRNFKDTLLEFPDLREAYFTHHDAETQKFALRFLEAREIQIIQAVGPGPESSE